MIKEREPALERINVIIQIFWTIIGYYFVLWYSGIVWRTNFFEKKEHLIIAIIMVPLWFWLLEMFEMGTMARMQSYRNILKKYLIITFFGTFIMLFFIQLFDYQSLVGYFTIKFAVLNFFVLSTQKIAGRMVLRYFRSQGYNTRMILIIADDSTIPFIKQIDEMDDWGYKIWGIISNSEKVKKECGLKFSVYPESENFAKLIDEKIIDEVFFCKHDFDTIYLQKLINECKEIGVSFHLHNKVLSFGGIAPKISFLNRQLFLSFRNTPENYVALQVKKTFDFFMSFFTLILISPIILVIAILIKLEDGGPILFKQIRVGRHGRLFKCLKFRTMVVNAEDLQEKLMSLNEQEGPVFKIKKDPRVTRIGRFLRKTSLDELPQFINVLFGDMSIVGPRPPVPSEVKQYERSLNRRLSINPGITCIWQVSGRNNIPFDKWMEMDMEYIDNWSLTLDFIIILKTFKVIFKSDGM